MLRAARTRAGNVNAFMGIIIKLRTVVEGVAGSRCGVCASVPRKKTLHYDGRAFAGDEKKMIFPFRFPSFSV